MQFTGDMMVTVKNNGNKMAGISKRHYFIAFLSLFCLFFNLKIKGIPLTSNIVLALCGIALFAGRVANNPGSILFNKSFLRMLLVYDLLIVALLGTMPINGNYDFSLLKIFAFNLVICFFSAYFCVYIIYKYKFSLEDLLKLVTIVFFVQILIVTVFFLKKDVMRLVYNYFDMGESINERIDSLFAYRAFGLGFGFDFGTAELTCACLCGMHLYLTQEKKNFRWLIIVAICSLVGIFIARTMFIGIFFLFLFFLFTPCRYKNRKWKTVFYFLFLMITVLGILITVIDWEKYQRTIMWVFDIFFQITSRKSVSSGSLYEITHDMIWYPGDFTFVFGDGLFKPNGLQYMNTDVGYMRLILYFGLIGTIFTVLFICMSGKSFFCEKKNKNLKYLAFFITVFQLVFMYKIMYLLMDFFTLFIIYNSYPYINKQRNTLSLTTS